MTLEPEMSERLTVAGARARSSTEERDALIVEAAAAGGSLREIAAATGLSHMGVKRILERRR